MSKKQMGFTLIEIVMVLVLLGILSAVAVPKYFDLRAQAEQKSVMAIASEYQARLNGSFAENLLEGKTCSVARTAAVEEANKLSVDGYTFGTTAISSTKGGSFELTITSTKDTTAIYGSSKTEPFKIQPIGVPECRGDS